MQNLKSWLVSALASSALFVLFAPAARAADVAVFDQADDYTYRLPQAVTLQFLGVSPSVTGAAALPANRIWWMPNGIPAAIAISSVPSLKAAALNYTGEIYREFVISVVDGRKQPVPIDAAIAVPSELAATDRSADILKHGAIRHVSTLPAGTEKCDVYVGVAAGKWTNAAVCKGINGASVITSDGKSVLFSQVIELPTCVVVPISDNLITPIGVAGATAVDTVDFQVVAIDTTGRVIPADKMLSGSATAQIRLTTAVFPNINLAAIREIRVQTRPYHWVQFPRVALTPASHPTPTSVLASQPTETPAR